MSTITTRSGKGSPLTNNEVDTNFTNLNTDKLESADLAGYATLSGATFTGEVEATGFNGDLTGAILFKGQAGEALTKGDPVYISGISGNKTVVSKADANDANKMPCFGIVDATVSANADCSVVTFGTLQGLDTSSFSEGDELFVSDTGTLATTAPTGESSQIQKIGKVTRSHASTGSIKVMGAGRTNAVPNLNDGQFFLGNGSNQAVSTDFTTSVLGEISAGTGIGISGSGVISNSAPDQTVSLTGGTGISTSGTYPNFTITNDSPDQTVSLTGAGATSISGTYPNFTITSVNTTYSVGDGGLTQNNFTDALKTNYDTAYSWGNHASAGYLTSFDITTQTDTKYLRSNAADTAANRITFTDGISLEPNDGIRFGGTANIHLRALTNNANSAIDLSGGSLSIGGFGNTVWHAGNDGSGSGLDADTVDGQHASAFLGATATAAEASAIDVVDTRNEGARAPNDYGDRQVTAEFTDDINGTWWSSLTVKGWGDGYAPWQLVGYSSTGQNENLYVRFGHGSNNAWSSLRKIWHAGNDGAGSGLDADVLDGLAPKSSSGSTGANQILRSHSNNYFYHNSWIQVGGSGLFSSTTNGAHFNPNTTTTYGTWRSSGSRGGYDGIVFDGGGDVAIMYDGNGNGGLYRQANGRWHIYHHVGNNCLAIGGSGTSSTYEAYVHGDLYATGNITAYSDARIKENVVTIDSALEKVESMRGVYYNKIDDPDKTKEVGFIAQEVNEVIPEAVTYAEDVDQYGVKYANITALLVESVKELSQQVKDLQAEVKELKENV